VAKSNRRKTPGQTGCGFLLGTGVVLVVLLLLNIWIVRTFGEGTILSMDTRLFQAAQFVLPLVMTFGQLWVYDYFVTWKRFRRDESDTGK
jgi:hypothetical protein